MKLKTLADLDCSREKHCKTDNECEDCNYKEIDNYSIKQLLRTRLEHWESLEIKGIGSIEVRGYITELRAILGGK